MKVYIVISGQTWAHSKVFTKLDDAIKYKESFYLWEPIKIYETVMDHPEIENKNA